MNPLIAVGANLVIIQSVTELRASTIVTTLEVRHDKTGTSA